MVVEMKVAVLYDAEGWAQHQNALGLQRFAPDWCEVELFQLGKHGTLSEYDVVYNLNLPSSSAGQVSCVASHAWMYPALDPDNWRTRGVNPCRNAITGSKHLGVLTATVCRNHTLGRWAKQHCQRVGVYPAGVNTALFFPCQKPQRKLRVGWCGQVHDDDPHGQVKGYREVYLPLVEKVGERYDFEAVTNTAANRRSPEEMARWFRSLDIFLSTSCADGTPNPPFQAAACGAVVIATEVGQLAEWQELKSLNLLLPSYGNQPEADGVVELIVSKLKAHEDTIRRRNVADVLVNSIDIDYSYRVLAPRILKFVCGMTP